MEDNRDYVIKKWELVVIICIIAIIVMLIASCTITKTKETKLRILKNDYNGIQRRNSDSGTRDWN